MSKNFNINLDYNKPRKIDENTIIYLKNLEENIDNIQLNDDNIINNILDEIKYKICSIISSRDVNILIEKMCYYCNIIQLNNIIKECIQYNIFLCINRYSSHVIQV